MNAFYPSGKSLGSGFKGSWGISLYVASIFLHFVFIGVFFFFGNSSPQRVLPPIIQVDLVSMSLPGETKSMPGKTIATAVGDEKVKTPQTISSTKSPKVIADMEKKIATPEPEPEQESQSVKIVTKKTDRIVSVEAAPMREPGRKLALKKKTFHADKVVDNAVKSIEKSVEKKLEDQTDNTLGKAFSRLEKAVEKQSGSRENGLSGAVAGVSGPGASGDKSEYTAIDLYNLELMYRIKQNWAFSEQLARAENGIEARVLIKILRNGEIRDIWFETRSGNRYLDESALKAIKKSSPLPPLPKGYATYDIGLQFTPSGLK